MTIQGDPDTRAEKIAASIREQVDPENGSRRRFLSRSALTAGTLLALGGGSGFVFAQGHDDGENDTNTTTGNETTSMKAAFDDVDGTDLDVIQYALTLENLEAAFYREGLESFSQEDFEDAAIVDSYTSETDQSVYEYVQTLADHEAAHVEVLSNAVMLLGGEAPLEVSYEFGVETVEEFIGLGQVLENTGVSAYAGAAPFIESPDLLRAALSIHSVEARHAAFLNDINSTSPFPDAFDAPSSQDEILDAVTPFIVSEPPGDGNETVTPGDGNETATPGGNETVTATDIANGNETATESE